MGPLRVWQATAWGEMPTFLSVDERDNRDVGREVRLLKALTGYQPYHLNERTEIPQGAKVAVINYDLNESDSMVEWRGRTFVVDKYALASLAQPV